MNIYQESLSVFRPVSLPARLLPCTPFPCKPSRDPPVACYKFVLPKLHQNKLCFWSFELPSVYLFRLPVCSQNAGLHITGAILMSKSPATADSTDATPVPSLSPRPLQGKQPVKQGGHEIVVASMLWWPS